MSNGETRVECMLSQRKLLDFGILAIGLTGSTDFTEHGQTIQ